jgi:LysR family glycine cleavage system transcriptional activator
VRQLEEVLGTQLFGRSDFSLTTEGTNYLQQVREGWGRCSAFPTCPYRPGASG